ncbi:MAG: acyltransferase family protein [Bacteroidales bacterium]|nr:acyltransferase family protein [Bacteroidales bacterium]
MGPLKALMALIIVLGHFYYYSDCPVFVPFHKMAATAVAMFFFISGFGLVKSWNNKGSSYLIGFLKYRLTKILAPAIILLLLHFLLCGTRETTLLALLWRLVKYGQAYPPQYWFLFVIIFDYILFWFAFRFLPLSARLPFLFLGSLAFIFFAVWVGYDRCWWICSFSFPCGAVYAMREDTINSFCGKNIAFYISSLAILSLAAIGTYLTGNQFVWTLFYMVTPMGIALIVAAIKPDKYISPLLGLLGIISYEIYLSHLTMMELFHKYPVAISPEWLYILTVFGTTIVVSFLVNNLCKSTLSRK